MRMSKASRSHRALPVLLADQLRKLGADIAIARKRRRIALVDMAKRMMVSLETVQRLEKGDPAVGIGIVATALWVLGLHGRIGELITPEKDIVGLQEDLRRLPGAKRRRSSGKSYHDKTNLDF